MICQNNSIGGNLALEVSMTDTGRINYSVVVPLEGRVPLVRRLLASIHEADLPIGTEIEILVVDSSPPPEAAAIKALCAEFGVRYLSGSRSVRQKRNQGAAEARHPYLLFLDSDCEASRELFIAYSESVRSAEKADWHAAAGPTRFSGGETAFTRMVQCSSLLAPFRLPEADGILLWTTTSNFLVARQAFESVGGFRENLPGRLGGDDTEFCLRLYEAGGRIRAVPGAFCYHSWHTWSSPWALIRNSPYSLLSPVEGLRVNATPVAEVSPILPNTMACTLTAVPQDSGMSCSRR